MGEVLCVTQGNPKQLAQWAQAKPDRYVVWVGVEHGESHPRFYYCDDHELAFQQIAAQLLYLPFVYDDPAHPSLQRLARIQTEVHYRSADFIDQGVKLLSNFRASLQSSFKHASQCFGAFSAHPAIVCGAGPSLKEVIPFLKENKDRFLIMGCGAGMQALLAAGIEPHLAVHVDPDPYHQFPTTAVPLFFQLRTSHATLSRAKGPRFIMSGSGEFLLERKIEEKLEMEPATDGGWTATTRGAALAAELGCPAIYFAGVDFSASSAPYAKGVQPPQEGALLKITLSDGSVVQTRSDWLLAAEWLGAWALQRPPHTCAFATQPNSLMPHIPAVDLKTVVAPEGVSCLVQKVFAECTEVSGKEIWDEIAASFKKCQMLTEQFLTHFQTIFPKPPSSDPTCVQIMEEIDKQDATVQIVDPIWNHWEVVLRRQPDSHPDALIVHRLLLIKSLADQFYV